MYNLHSVTSNAVAQRFASRKVVLWEGVATVGDTLDFTNKDMNMNSYEYMEVVIQNFAHLRVLYSRNLNNGVRLKATANWDGSDGTVADVVDYYQHYIIDIVDNKIINCGWFLEYNYSFTINIDRNILSNPNAYGYGCRSGNVVRLTIECDSSNCQPYTFLKLAGGLPPSVTITNGTVILDDHSIYQRVWIDGNGDLFMYIGGGSVYTLAVRLSIVYIVENSQPYLKGGNFNIEKIIGYK